MDKLYKRLSKPSTWLISWQESVNYKEYSQTPNFISMLSQNQSHKGTALERIKNLLQNLFHMTEMLGILP